MFSFPTALPVCKGSTSDCLELAWFWHCTGASRGADPTWPQRPQRSAPTNAGLGAGLQEMSLVALHDLHEGLMVTQDGHPLWLCHASRWWPGFQRSPPPRHHWGQSKGRKSGSGLQLQVRNWKSMFREEGLIASQLFPFKAFSHGACFYIYGESLIFLNAALRWNINEVILEILKHQCLDAAHSQWKP